MTIEGSEIGVERVHTVAGLTKPIISGRNLPPGGWRFRFRFASARSDSGAIYQCRVMTPKQHNGARRTVTISADSHGLFYLRAFIRPSAAPQHDTGSLHSLSTAQQLHERLCVGHSMIANAIDKSFFATSVTAAAARKLGPCKACTIAKIVRQPHPDSESVFTRPLELVVADLSGPFPRACGGEQYVLVVRDVASGLYEVPILGNKAQAPVRLREILLRWQAKHAHKGYKTVVLRTDNGGEFMTTDFQGFLLANATRHETSAPGNSASNGIAERSIRSVMTVARAMIIHDAAWQGAPLGLGLGRADGYARAHLHDGVEDWRPPDVRLRGLDGHRPLDQGHSRLLCALRGQASG